MLLTTPESLEAMLLIALGRPASAVRQLRVVVVDELHAFAGDDRGWHLLSVLERVHGSRGGTSSGSAFRRRSGTRRLSWSGWLDRPGGGRSSAAGASDPDPAVDAVGDLENAALVISRLYRGEKRLVFADSRSRVEELADRLRGLGIDTYVSHSSLGLDERRRAEEAFAERSDCVIVATSTLELGMDVGDLDRVIQIDSPGRVSSFLQRLGTDRQTIRHNAKPPVPDDRRR